ncbi:zf-HC2 domain-containing protein [Streptosporangium sp. NPDC002524]|uniref:zf-HC2 domain-containing protein n=1 Tax=Streptosporangium sp. NPDC002524 TaxID=3154537 RepID=UPI003317B299
MMMTCDEVRMSLGVYVLGALEPDERVLVEAHLAECAECRAELEELAGVTTFLGRVSESDVAQVASPPTAVLDRLLSAKVRRRRTNRLMLSLAASVLVVGLGGGTLWTVVQTQGSQEAVPASAPLADRAPAAAREAQEDARSFSDTTAPEADARTSAKRAPGTPTGAPAPADGSAPATSGSSTAAPVPRPSASPTSESAPEILLAPSELRFKGADRTGTVRATVTVSPGEGATTIKVMLTGVAKGTRCRLEVIGEGGLRETAGNWVVNRAAYDESGGFEGTTTIPPERITSFEITTAEGRVLLTIPVP